MNKDFLQTMNLDEAKQALQVFEAVYIVTDYIKQQHVRKRLTIARRIVEGRVRALLIVKGES